MVIEVEFGSRGSAGKIRNDPQYKPFLASSDDGRQTTLKLKENTPEQAINYITGEAAESMRTQADKAGQANLTDLERSRIDFSKPGVNVPKVRSIKGIAQNVGVRDWQQFADLTLTVDENRRLLKKAAREERGSQDMGRERDSEAMIAQRFSQAHTERKRSEVGRAKDFALIETDPEAQEFVQDQGAFDIAFNQQNNRLIGQGEDFDRLVERHENRSERAQALDEKKSAKKTRDPVQWANNPSKYDFPAIDTVQPIKLHEQRSERAQEMDEREIAPQAESKEQWAMHPDQYDWKTVDAPESYGPTMNMGQPIHPNEDERTRVQQQAVEADVSLAPEEAIEGVGLGTPSAPGGQAYNAIENRPVETDRIDQEQKPPESALSEQAGAIAENFEDDRAQDSQLLNFGMETDATQHRESKTAEEQATVFGIDDRDDASRGAENDTESEQQGFEVFGGGVRENETLF